MSFSAPLYNQNEHFSALSKEDTPLVSIVLATYNGDKFLEKQLESLFLQSYPNIEIIAIDDASSDDTENILRSHAVKHPNFKIFVNDTNLGFIKNFDKGCGLASGNFIALCDQDDYWNADKIMKLVQAIGDNSMVYCDSFLTDENLQKTGKRISDVVNCQPFSSCLEQAVFCRIYGHASLFTKALYAKAHPFLEVIPHDWWLCYTATLQKGIGYLPEPLVHYRQHSTNLFGVAGSKRRKQHWQDKKDKSHIETEQIRTRVNAFYNACPDDMFKEKKVLRSLVKSYSDFSLANNFARFFIFLRYQNTFLKVKKHSTLHRLLFCFKMFVKIK